MDAPEKPDGDPPSMGSFYNNPLFSDVEIKFSGSACSGHRSILSSKSRYPYKAFSGGFKEAHTKVIDLGDDDDPECIRDILKFIYGCPVNAMWLSQRRAVKRSNIPSEDLLRYNLKLFATADKYDIPSLRIRISETLVRDFHSLLRKGDIDIAATLTDIFNYVGDRTLKDAAMDFCCLNMTRLTTVPAFIEMLKEDHDLSVTLLTRTMQALRDGQKVWSCGSCDHVQQRPGKCLAVSCRYDNITLTERMLW